MLQRFVEDVKQCPRFILKLSALHHFPGSLSLSPLLSKASRQAGRRSSKPKSIVLLKQTEEEEGGGGRQQTASQQKDKGCGLIKILP
jgi:hypothetical protein